MIHLLYGEEDYLILKRKKELMQRVTISELNLAIFNSFSPEILELLYTYPVMDDVRVVVIDCDTLSQLNNPHFMAYVKKPCATTVLVIHVRNTDWRAKYAMDIKKTGICEYFPKLKSIDSLHKILIEELDMLGSTMSEEALQEFMRRENYFDNADVTLLAIMNDLQSLSIITKNITADVVKQYIKSNDVGNAYALAKLILSGNAVELRRQASLIPADEAIKKLGLLLREYRVAYKAIYFSQKEIGARYITLKGMSKESLLRGIKTCTDLISAIKIGKIDSRIALQTAFDILILK